MAKRRKAISLEVKVTVLHEAGYKCANPVCRHVITLDLHHMEYISAGGPDTADNLLPLCPNCHALHHGGTYSNRVYQSVENALDRPKRGI